MKFNHLSTCLIFSTNANLYEFAHTFRITNICEQKVQTLFASNFLVKPKDSCIIFEICCSKSNVIIFFFVRLHQKHTQLEIQKIL